MYSEVPKNPQKPCVTFLASDLESSDPRPTSLSECRRSRSLNSPRRMRLVHFKELDECLSNLSIADAHPGLPPRPTRSASDAGSDSERGDGPTVKKEKRLKLEVTDDSRATAGSGAMPPLNRIRTGHAISCARNSLSCSDINVDQLSPGVPVPRTSCSTPGVSPSPNLSPLSGSSHSQSHSDREPSEDSPIAQGSPRGVQAGEWAPGASETLGTSKPGGKGSIYERRGRKSPGQLSLKRCRSVHHSSTWTGKREEVLGAEPGTPKLSKCDTL